MAYNKTGLTLIDVAVVDRVKTFEYTTDDTLATVLANGYFAPDASDYDDLGNKIAKGDTIIVKCSNGTNVVYVTQLNNIRTSKIEAALVNGQVTQAKCVPNSFDMTIADSFDFKKMCIRDSIICLCYMW